MVSLFCRHNRFTADCPICSRGTVLESPGRREGSRRRAAPEAAEREASTPARARGGRPASGGQGAVAAYRGRYAAAGPYEREGSPYEVRLEHVPGGVRLAEWSSERLLARAPVLAREDVGALVAGAAAAGAVAEEEREALLAALAPEERRGDEPTGEAPYGASPGRSGELSEELRVEPLGGDRVRVARWVLRPGTGWDMLDAPPMLPAQRYAEALRDAAARGVLA